MGRNPRRTPRLFAIAEYLRGRRTGVTAEALAARFGVTVRTIYRDLDALREASLPVNAERGRGGGYALDRAYALPPVNFTHREAALLVVAGEYVTSMRLVPFAATVRSALDKVRAALDASSQRELVRVLDRIAFTGVPTPPVAPAVARALEQAWFDRVPLRIRYVGSNGVETDRRVEVRGLLIERSGVCVQCHDLDKGEDRAFRVDRVVAAVAEPALAAAPPPTSSSRPAGPRSARRRSRGGTSIP